MYNTPIMRLWRENIGWDPAAVEAGSHSNLNKKARGPCVVAQFGSRSGEFTLPRGGIKPPVRAGCSNALAPCALWATTLNTERTENLCTTKSRNVCRSHIFYAARGV